MVCVHDWRLLATNPVEIIEQIIAAMCNYLSGCYADRSLGSGLTLYVPKSSCEVQYIQRIIHLFQTLSFISFPLLERVPSLIPVEYIWHCFSFANAILVPVIIRKLQSLYSHLDADDTCSCAKFQDEFSYYSHYGFGLKQIVFDCNILNGIIIFTRIYKIHIHAYNQR